MGTNRSAILKSEDQEELEGFASKAWSLEDRVLAVKKIKDQEFLTTLLLNDVSYKIREAAFQRVSDATQLARIASFGKDTTMRKDAARKIKDDELLYRVVTDTPFEATVNFILNNLASENLLKKLIVSGPYDLKMRALTKLDDQKTLESLGLELQNDRIIYLLIPKLTSENTREKLASNLLMNNQSLNQHLPSLVKYISSEEILYKVLNKLLSEQTDREYETVESEYLYFDVLKNVVSRLSNEKLSRHWNELDAESKKSLIRVFTREQMLNIISLEEEINILMEILFKLSSVENQLKAISLMNDTIQLSLSKHEEFQELLSGAISAEQISKIGDLSPEMEKSLSTKLKQVNETKPTDKSDNLTESEALEIALHLSNLKEFKFIVNTLSQESLLTLSMLTTDEQKRLIIRNLLETMD